MPTTMSHTREVQDAEADLALRLENISVSYGMDRGESRVVDNASLDIRHNEIIGIVGESGSGKSMVASSLINAVPPPGEIEGEVLYYPEDGSEPVDILSLTDDELRTFRWEKVSMVFQGAMSSFNPTMTIRGHFEETLRAHDYDIVEGMSYARDLIRDLYLDPDYVFDAHPHELSGGMKQRVLIALSLVLKPEVLVMDEPTASLDLLMQRSIVNLISEIQENYDISILFITHDLPLVSGLVDRLAVMYAFEFIEVGDRNEILRNPSHPYTRALLTAVPNLDTPVEEMEPIKGAAPDPVNVPTGCSYHPRCPMADETCYEEDPEHFRVSDNHTTACFHWENIDEELSYTIGNEESIPVDVVEEKPQKSKGITVSEDRERIVSLENTEVHFKKEASFLDKLLRQDEDEVVRAVDNVTLEIGDNDIVALVGESGCGKTTLGKTAIGLQRPTGGSVLYKDQDIWKARDGSGNPDVSYRQIRQSLQIIHQDPSSSLNPNRTVQANIAAPIKKYRPDLSAEMRQSVIHHLLERLNMDPASDYAKRFPHQLSGGEQQRIALGRALLMQPDLILADESVSALDVSLRVEMMDLLLDLQTQFDTSFLFISHDFANARYVTTKADGRIGVMYLGDLVEIGSAEEILQNPKHPYTKALVWSTAPLDPEEAEAAMDDEAPIRKIDVPTPENAPDGCKFHTRCPKIIPPDDIDIDQKTFNEITDLRHAIENDELETQRLPEKSEGNRDDDQMDGVSTQSFIETVIDQEFETDISEPHRERVKEALRHVAQDNNAEAEAILQEHYESVCERNDPNLRSDHPVACHLYDS